MEMNKNLCRRLGNLSLPVLLSVVLLASCRDEIETGAYTGPYIRFSVSEGSEWHSTRAGGRPGRKGGPTGFRAAPARRRWQYSPLPAHALHRQYRFPLFGHLSGHGRPYPCHARKNGDSLRIDRSVGCCV